MAGPIKKILVTIAGAEISILTAKYAICMAKSLGSELYVQYVMNTKALENLLRAKVFVAIEEVEYEKELEEQGSRYLANIKKLAEEKDVDVFTVFSKGIIHDEVVKKANELGIDMLVMGELKEISSRKDSFYDEGERIFREAGCPVLVVKGKDNIEQMYDALGK